MCQSEVWLIEALQYDANISSEMSRLPNLKLNLVEDDEITIKFSLR